MVLKEEVTEIKLIKTYYVYEGRNAWYSTWIHQYYPDCLHLNLKSAKISAERKRNYGSVFYIQEVPAIYFEIKGHKYIVNMMDDEDEAMNLYKSCLFKFLVDQNLTVFDVIGKIDSRNIKIELEEENNSFSVVTTRLDTLKSFPRGTFYDLGWELVSHREIKSLNAA